MVILNLIYARIFDWTLVGRIVRYIEAYLYLPVSQVELPVDLIELLSTDRAKWFELTLYCVQMSFDWV